MVGLTRGRFAPGKILGIPFPLTLGRFYDVAYAVLANPLLAALLYLSLCYFIRVHDSLKRTVLCGSRLHLQIRLR